MIPLRQSITGILERLAGRLRRGLLIEEVLESLARAGVLVFPYYLTERHLTAPGADRSLPSPLAFRPLREGDASAMADVPGRPLAVAVARARLLRSRYFGLFLDGQLVAYNSASVDTVRLPFRQQALFTLEPDEAYLWDTFVSPMHRGARLSQHLSAEIAAQLLSEGRDCIFGLQGAFNTPSRQFSRRLGARRVELRLLVGLTRGFALDLRLWSWRAITRTRRICGVLQRPRASS